MELCDVLSKPPSRTSAVSPSRTSGRPPVAALRDIRLADGPVQLFEGVDVSLEPRARAALVGRNGAGKSTLMRILTGEIIADSGDRFVQPGLRVVYVPQEPVITGETLIDHCIAGGVADWEASAWLSTFELDPNKSTRGLSGGEIRRTALARAFAENPDLLLLDEPTNHLDIFAIQTLEASILESTAALLVVSHDRAFVDNVVTQTLSPLGDGRWRESVGGYSDWLRERDAQASSPLTRTVDATDAASVSTGGTGGKAKAKLSYKEERELAALPGDIETLEMEQRSLADSLCAPDYPHSDAARVTKDGARMAEIEALLMQKLERWEQLEAEAQRLKSR